MTRPLALPTRLLAAAATALLLGAAATTTAPRAAQRWASPAAHDDPAATAALRVTERDVAASNAKAAAAYEDLVGLWRGELGRIGARFVAPALVRYRVAAGTDCGVMRAGNASYCAADNTIYFDEVFVAAQAKRAAAATGADGDMAGVGIIAHEMGHAVAAQLGAVSRVPYENEATADCLAGAFARHADEAGSLEKGDVDEAFFAMAMAGDPEPQLTGNRRLDRPIVLRASLLGHGTYEQRTENFRSGMEGGAGACIEELR